MTASRIKEEFISAYSILADKIFRYFLFRLSDREVASEMAQETFKKVWETLARGKEIENLNSYIYQIAHNLTVDYYKVKSKKTVSLDQLCEVGYDLADPKNPSSKTILDSLAALTEINKIDDDLKDVVLLRYVDELPVKEIAGILNVSENLVSVRLHRALNLVKANLSNE